MKSRRVEQLKLKGDWSDKDEYPMKEHWSLIDKDKMMDDMDRSASTWTFRTIKTFLQLLLHLKCYFIIIIFYIFLGLFWSFCIFCSQKKRKQNVITRKELHYKRILREANYYLVMLLIKSVPYRQPENVFFHKIIVRRVKKNRCTLI